VHTSIRTFFSWAKARSYLPKNEATEAEAVSKVKVGDTETGIFTPAQIKSLLAIATPEMIPFIAIGAFAGLRAAEIARLDWSAVDLKRKIIHLRADQAKTASRRIIPVSDNLRAWLLPRVGNGRVVPNAEMQKKVAPLAMILGFEWPNNVLRHSFISYRIAIVKSAEQVALEAGNSPTIIFKHYRELTTEEQANEWFGIFPLPSILSAF
jgi:integrase